MLFGSFLTCYCMEMVAFTFAIIMDGSILPVTENNTGQYEVVRESKMRRTRNGTAWPGRNRIDLSKRAIQLW
jgi:hypothetical protein